MEKETMVSIIIPVYNARNYVTRCLESIRNQTYRNLEILLMVGRCTDDSLQLCIDEQKNDERIIIVSRKDGNLSDARNYALKILKGKYFLYLDIDDYVDRQWVEKMVCPLEENKDINVSICGFYKVNNSEITMNWNPTFRGRTELSFIDYIKKVYHVMVKCF